MSRLFKLCLFSSFLLLSCVKIQEKQPALKVGGLVWSVGEIQSYMELRLSDFQDNLSAEKIKEEILKEIIFRSLLEVWAKKNNIFPKKIILTKEEKSLFSKNQKKLRALKNFKVYLSLKKALLEELEKKSPNPSPKDQRSFYEKNRSLFKEPSQCQLEQILVGNQKLARFIYNKIKAGESFAALSKIYSLKKSPGWIKKGHWALFDKVCFEEKSALSPVLKSPEGFHIFLRKGKKASRQKSFSESQKKIIKTLKKQKIPSQMQDWLKQETLKTPVFKNKNLDQIKIQYKRERL